MKKKTFKIKTQDERSSLIEYIVQKRVQLLDYIDSLHTPEGELWMNTVRLNQFSIGQYFGVSELCLRNSQLKPSEAPGVPTEDNISNFSEIHLALDDNKKTSASVNVSFNSLPPLSSAESTWKSRYLPCYAALALSLSDLLMVPMSGEEFLECVTGLLLEVEVAYAGGTATKTMAQRALKQYRHGMSDRLKQFIYHVAGTEEEGDGPYGGGLNASFTSPSANHNRMSGGPESPTSGMTGGVKETKGKDADSGSEGETVKYIFLSTQHLRYQCGSPSYDVVIPSLCSVLTTTYRKLCDYDLFESPDLTKSILVVDKKIRKLILDKLCHEYSRISRQRYMREALLLSPTGLFSEIGVPEGLNFLQSVLESTGRGDSGSEAGGSEVAKEEESSSGDDMNF